MYVFVGVFCFACGMTYRSQKQRPSLSILYNTRDVGEFEGRSIYLANDGGPCEIGTVYIRDAVTQEGWKRIDKPMDITNITLVEVMREVSEDPAQLIGFQAETECAIHYVGSEPVCLFRACWESDGPREPDTTMPKFVDGFAMSYDLCVAYRAVGEYGWEHFVTLCLNGENGHGKRAINIQS